MKRLLLLCAIVSLAACERSERPVFHSQQINVYDVVDIKSPKHFRVVLENVKTGERRQVNVSKHCNRWRELKMGTRFQFKEVTYVYPTSQRFFSEIENVKSICPGN